jgi:signal transduction histidine kinase
MWADPTATDGASSNLVLEAVRLASRLASTDGQVRGASFLALRSDVLTCLAASGSPETWARASYRTSEHATFDRAIRTGEIVDDDAQVVVPVTGEVGVGGIIVIDGAGGLDESQRTALANIARIVSLGMRQAATVTELQLEAERSRRLERLKSEFLNIAAHELRSPLGIIRGYASMLGEGMLPKADGELALSRISEKTDEMARLISEMLETARLETLGLELELEPVDLLEIVDNAVLAMRPLMGPSHQFALASTRDDIAAVADKRRLTTMLTNLIDNAIKYSPGGGEIEISCEHDDREATILVRDHGIGINAEQAHLLFTRFGRLVTPETSHIRGTGLGLYLAREIARLHGGDITVKSNPDSGSTFVVTLPLAYPTDTKSPPAP